LVAPVVTEARRRGSGGEKRQVTYGMLGSSDLDGDVGIDLPQVRERPGRKVTIDHRVVLRER
jgi:hypothetical protein